MLTLLCGLLDSRLIVPAAFFISRIRKGGMGTQVWKPRNHELKKFQIFSCFPGFLIQISEKFYAEDSPITLEIDLLARW